MEKEEGPLEAFYPRRVRALVECKHNVHNQIPGAHGGGDVKQRVELPGVRELRVKGS